MEHLRNASFDFQEEWEVGVMMDFFLSVFPLNGCDFLSPSQGRIFFFQKISQKFWSGGKDDIFFPAPDRGICFFTLVVRGNFFRKLPTLWKFNGASQNQGSHNTFVSIMSQIGMNCCYGSNELKLQQIFLKNLKLVSAAMIVRVRYSTAARSS